MIVPASKLTPKPKPVGQIPKLPPPKDEVAEAIRELPEALRHLPAPQVTIQTPPRLSEWVFNIHRGEDGKIDRIQAKGTTVK